MARCEISCRLITVSAVGTRTSPPFGLCAKCHVWTAPAVQEENLTYQRAGRVQPCIRPLNAAAVAAGPDVIR